MTQSDSYLIAEPSTGDAILIIGASTKSNLNQCAAAVDRIGLGGRAEAARVLGGERDSGCAACPVRILWERERERESEVTLTFQTPEGAVLALMLFAKSHCQSSTHERRPKTFASKPT